MPIHIVANMMMYNDEPFLHGSIPALQEVCDRIVMQDNGSTDGSYETAKALARPEDTVLHFPQFSPIDYSRQRNNMLRYVLVGEWVLKWDPDEVLSDAMRDGLRDKLEQDDNIHTGWSIPGYHIMKEPRKCLRFELGFGHLCLFRKTSTTEYRGAMHEQPVLGDPWGGINPDSGMGVIHFSYFAEKRLRRKSVWYSKQHNSGFTRPNDLASRLDTKPVDLPPHVTYAVDPAWLEKIKEAE